MGSFEKAEQSPNEASLRDSQKNVQYLVENSFRDSNAKKESRNLFRVTDVELKQKDSLGNGVPLEQRNPQSEFGDFSDFRQEINRGN